MQLRQQQLQRGLAAAFVLLSVLALSAGLSSLELQPGSSLSPESLGGLTRFNPIELIRLPPSLLSFLGVLLRVVFWLLVPWAFIYVIRSREARRRVLMQLFFMLLLAFAVISLSKGVNLSSLDVPQLAADQSSSSGSSTALTPSQLTAPNWVFLALSALVVGAVALAGYRIIQSLGPAQTDTAAMRSEARAALQALESGVRLESVIQRAYLRLCQASLARRGVTRASHATPREFVGPLEAAGLPVQPVHVLTRLFERARYGDAPMDHEDEREAVTALREILRALGEL